MQEMADDDVSANGLGVVCEGASASMSQWMVVVRDGRDCLFGFADRHPRTGGLSWIVSSPIVELDEGRAVARTASGRIYGLGRRIGEDDLDEEATLARAILVNGLEGVHLGPCDLPWLVACKWARHLDLAAPDRHDCDAVARFLASAEYSYLSRMLRTW